MTGQTDARKSLERLFLLGRPLSPLYGLFMTLRSNLYRWGLMQQHALGVPVISVGNLVLGGTGKTPLVIYIAKLLQQQKRNPAILSRGYKGSASALINVVSNTTTLLLDAAEAGDEPRLLAERLPGIPVITGRNRFITGRFARDSLGVDTLILDDGFQHLGLKRDVNLVLFATPEILGNGRVLPGGVLREPLSALERADAFIITGGDNMLDSDTQKFIAQLETQYPEKPVFTTGYEPGKMLFVIAKGKNDTIELAEARKISLYGFCGIARPESFKKTLENSAMNLNGFQAYADHHAYTGAEIESLLLAAKNSGAGGLITTEKDLVKLYPFLPLELPLLVLPVHLRSNNRFDLFLLSRLANILPAG